MSIKNRPKVYFGNGGMRGVSEVRREGWVSRSVGPKKKPLACVGGGVSPRVILASGGIARGATIRVSGAGKPSVKSVEAAKKPVMTEIKMVGREARTIEPKVAEEKVQPPMTDRERAAVEFLADMERRRPMPEAVEEKPSEPKAAEEKPTVEEDWEEPKLEAAVETVETRAVLPELPLVEEVEETGVGQRKRRHGKRGRRIESTEVSEEKRAEVQAAVEAAAEA